MFVKVVRTAIVTIAFCTVLIILSFRYMSAIPEARLSDTQDRISWSETDKMQLSALARRAVETLAVEIGERNTTRQPQLERAWEYIAEEYRRLGAIPQEQTYVADGVSVKNIYAIIPGTEIADEVVVVGAHYDSALFSPGADDNATGIAALFETLRYFVNHPPKRTIHIVAFTNEEPPSFQTSEMGSYQYAKMLREQHTNVSQMIAIDAIGVYYETPPELVPKIFAPILPEKANFITVVGNLQNRDNMRRAAWKFRQATNFPTEGLAAPEFFPGVSWSDQWSFWRHDYPGIMFTDTAIYRYHEYHSANDLPNIIDFTKLATVIHGILEVINDFVNNCDVY